MQDKTFRVALVQMRSNVSVAPNVESASQFIREAARGGADYVLTPENTAIMELDPKKLFEAIEPEESNSALEVFRDLARECKIWLHIGGMAIRLDDSKAANRSFLISPDGAIAARYDKIHMFDVDLPGGETYRESNSYAAGGEGVIADLPWCRIGMTICYDLRFPGLYRELALAGAKIITVPSAFTKVTGEAHWHILLRARAIETGCFVLAAAQGGSHEVGRDTYGHSLVISPWGEILAEAGVDPAVIYADIDLAKIEKVRGLVPSLQHGREVDVSSAYCTLPEEAA